MVAAPTVNGSTKNASSRLCRRKRKPSCPPIPPTLSFATRAGTRRLARRTTRRKPLPAPRSAMARTASHFARCRNRRLTRRTTAIPTEAPPLRMVGDSRTRHLEASPAVASEARTSRTRLLSHHRCSVPAVARRPVRHPRTCREGEAAAGNTSTSIRTCRIRRPARPRRPPRAIRRRTRSRGRRNRGTTPLLLAPSRDGLPRAVPPTPATTGEATLRTVAPRRRRDITRRCIPHRCCHLRRAPRLRRRARAIEEAR